MYLIFAIIAGIVGGGISEHHAQSWPNPASSTCSGGHS